MGASTWHSSRPCHQTCQQAHQRPPVDPQRSHATPLHAASSMPPRGSLTTRPAHPGVKKRGPCARMPGFVLSNLVYRPHRITDLSCPTAKPLLTVGESILVLKTAPALRLASKVQQRCTAGAYTHEYSSPAFRHLPLAYVLTLGHCFPHKALASSCLPLPSTPPCFLTPRLPSVQDPQTSLLIQPCAPTQPNYPYSNFHQAGRKSSWLSPPWLRCNPIAWVHATATADPTAPRGACTPQG